ncbi:MAG: 5-(carboxyamino)imidazole ribonucleotide mutase [Planctomycetes bacterium]|nr:5-(carboxyamino)imidazole ribonucleotide mutase [Planctomycetota bacterium]NOG53399.1 5-(carboxyamino)imidazole ribonucleotide mutase [Planctomycetota bacterium]
MSATGNPTVGIVMGSASDWPVMSQAARILGEFGVPYDAKVLSAHRNPEGLTEWLSSMLAGGMQVVIAGAGGAAHLPGVCASKVPVPVLGVPMMTDATSGLDSLLSIAQMPKGVPVGTLAIGKAGAINAGLLAVQILALSDEALMATWTQYRADQRKTPSDVPPMPGT